MKNQKTRRSVRYVQRDQDLKNYLTDDPAGIYLTKREKEAKRRKDFDRKLKDEF